MDTNRVQRPSPLGKFSSARPLLFLAYGAFLLWLQIAGLAESTSTFWTGVGAGMIGVIILSIARSVFVGPAEPTNGVDIGGHELTVTVGDDITVIPLAEATVRVVDTHPEGSRVRKLYIDHASGSTEVDTEGMMPLRITEYGDRLTDTLVERRRIMLIKEPPKLPPASS